MTDIMPLAVGDLKINDAASLIWIKVSQAKKLLWIDNPKEHDIGLLTQSIARYGFQEIPKYDINLPNVSGGTGAIQAGNGRVETLAWMEIEKYELPRGLGMLEKTGEWCMQILVGTDAKSRDMAIAYAIDSNNLTLSADHTPLDRMRLWDSQGYLALLKKLAKKGQLPVSTDGDDLDFMLFVQQFNPMEDVFDLDVSEVLKDEVLSISVVIPPKNFEPVVTAIRLLLEDNPEWGAILR